MKIIPYISVVNAKKTIKVYEELFGAKLLNTVPFDRATGKQFGFPADYDYENSTMHAEITIGDSIIYLGDLTTKKSIEENPIEILIELNTKEQADMIWAKVKAKKYKITMELQTQFWNAYYGRFIDEDGLGWQLNYPLPISTQKSLPETSKKTTSKGKKLSKSKSNTSESTLILTQILDAPIDLVFNYWIDPTKLGQWWGPKGFTTPICKIDLRIGGILHYCMRSPDGKNIWGGGIYQEIIRPTRIVVSDYFSDEKGNKVPASLYGMALDYPLEMQITATFEDLKGKTKLTINHEGMSITQQGDAKQGWTESLEKLTEILSKLK